eukprot:11435723-Prorocentrum_lima.AAC.1
MCGHYVSVDPRGRVSWFSLSSTVKNVDLVALAKPPQITLPSLCEYSSGVLEGRGVEILTLNVSA